MRDAGAPHPASRVGKGRGMRVAESSEIALLGFRINVLSKSCPRYKNVYKTMHSLFYVSCYIGGYCPMHDANTLDL